MLRVQDRLAVIMKTLESSSPKGLAISNIAKSSYMLSLCSRGGKLMCSTELYQPARYRYQPFRYRNGHYYSLSSFMLANKKMGPSSLDLDLLSHCCLFYMCVNMYAPEMIPRPGLV